MSEARRTLWVTLAVAGALWLANLVVVASEGNPVPAVRAELARFGYDPGRAALLEASYGMGPLGRRAEVRFLAAEAPDDVVRVEAVRRLAVGGWRVLELERLEGAAPGR